MKNALFDYNECKNLILTGILDALEQHKSDILAFPKHPIGNSKIKGMSLDIFPWHNLIQISFCSDKDVFEEEHIASWKYYDFVSSNSDNYNESLEIAADYVSSFWNDTEEEEETDYYIDLQLKANIIFLVGAEAILEKAVSEKLVSLGIDGAEWSDDMFSDGRFFMVYDDDKSINANYCEIVKANRAAKSFFEELQEAKSLE